MAFSGSQRGNFHEFTIRNTCSPLFIEQIRFHKELGCIRTIFYTSTTLILEIYYSAQLQAHSKSPSLPNESPVDT
jgi:hypothetical protein